MYWVICDVSSEKEEEFYSDEYSLAYISTFVNRFLKKFVLVFLWQYFLKRIQLGHFLKNYTIEMKNDTIELCRTRWDALLFRQQIMFSAKK